MQTIQGHIYKTYKITTSNNKYTAQKALDEQTNDGIHDTKHEIRNTKDKTTTYKIRNAT